MKNLFEITVLSILFFNLFAVADDKFINEMAKPGKPIPKFDVVTDNKSSAAPTSDFSGCQNADEQKQSQNAFDKIVKGIESTGEKVILSRKNPDSRSSNSVSYRFDAQKMQPGESVYLWVPADLAKKGTNFVILGHRQNPATTKGPKDGSKYDETPGLTSVQVYDANRPEKERWRHWSGMASGNAGAKFAERDTRFELEGLYQWSKIGHRGVKSGDQKHDALHGSVVKLVNLGTDEVELSELTYKTNIEKSKDQVENIFTDGTKFGDVSTQEDYVIGGGQDSEGIFPNAIALGPRQQSPKNLPAGWKFQDNQLMIPLPKGKILNGIELSAGDAHPDKFRNTDGGSGTKGWARLNIETQRNGMTTDVLMKSENVPPEGILMATPSKCGQAIQEGDYLVIKSYADTTFLGGLRLTFKDK